MHWVVPFRPEKWLRQFFQVLVLFKVSFKFARVRGIGSRRATLPVRGKNHDWPWDLVHAYLTG